MNNVSPLRYPGGKTRACKVLDEVLNEHFVISDYNNIISPFFGGGSFEFYIQNKYNIHVIANDKFTPLYNFWKICKENKSQLVLELNSKIGNIDKDSFQNMRSQIMNTSNSLEQSIMYFIINRCSFSGATLSGGFSLESASKRFTKSSINKIENLDLSNFTLYNLDFSEFIDKCYIKTINGDNNESANKNLMFLDPPYYLEKGSKLYGDKGNMHENFDHEKLFNCIKTKKNWIMTYNNCGYIKELYRNYKIIETNWSYGMNKSKQSSEIIIIG